LTGLEITTHLFCNNNYHQKKKKHDKKHKKKQTKKTTKAKATFWRQCPESMKIIPVLQENTANLQTFCSQLSLESRLLQSMRMKAGSYDKNPSPSHRKNMRGNTLD